MLASCSDEAVDYGDYLMAIVTYEGSSDNTSRFSYVSRDDLPEQTLVAAVDLSQSVKSGQRCLLRYTMLDDSSAPKSIRVDYVTAIPTGEISTDTAEQIAAQPATDMTVTSLWRSGKYLNINGWVPYTGKQCRLLLVADKADLGQADVNAWLIYDTLEEMLLFDRRVYASYDISSIWDSESLQTLSVHVGDRIFTLTK